MEQICEIDSNRDFFAHDADGEFHVFRTINSLFCWNFSTRLKVWEHQFVDGQLSLENFVIIRDGVAITIVNLGSYRLQILAYHLTTGIHQWETVLKVDILPECLLPVDSKLFLYCETEDEFLLISLNINTGKKVRSYTAIAAEFLLEWNQEPVLAGVRGIFDGCKDMSQLAKVEVYACSQWGNKTFIITSKKKGILSFAWVGVDFKDLKPLMELPSKNARSWKIYPLNENLLFVGNVSSGIYFFLKLNGGNCEYQQIDPGKGINMSEVVQVGEELYCILQREKPQQRIVAKIKLGKDIEIEQIPEIKHPSFIKAAGNMLLVSQLEGIRLWK